MANQNVEKRRAKRSEYVTIIGAKIESRNLAGRPTDMNPEGGVRSFVIRLDPDLANKLADEEWNVKISRQRVLDDGTVLEPKQYIPVEAWYNNYPPKIYIISDGSNEKTLLDADTVGCIDKAAIKNVDITFKPWYWTYANRSGKKALVDEMYVTIDGNAFEAGMSDLAKKYADYSEAAEEPLPF